MKKNTNSTSTILGIGAGVAALAAASYYFLGPKGEKHRAEMKDWMVSMKDEVINRMQSAKELSEEVYYDIVDSVTASFSETAKVGKEELGAFANHLKEQWKEILSQKMAEIPKKRSVAKVKKSVKKDK